MLRILPDNKFAVAQEVLAQTEVSSELSGLRRIEDEKLL